MIPFVQYGLGVNPEQIKKALEPEPAPDPWKEAGRYRMEG